MARRLRQLFALLQIVALVLACTDALALHHARIGHRGQSLQRASFAASALTVRPTHRDLDGAPIATVTTASSDGRVARSAERTESRLGGVGGRSPLTVIAPAEARRLGFTGDVATRTGDRPAQRPTARGPPSAA
jgi:hypothetical protein